MYVILYCTGFSKKHYLTKDCSTFSVITSSVYVHKSTFLCVVYTMYVCIYMCRVYVLYILHIMYMFGCVHVHVYLCICVLNDIVMCGVSVLCIRMYMCLYVLYNCKCKYSHIYVFMLSILYNVYVCVLY